MSDLFPLLAYTLSQIHVCNTSVYKTKPLIKLLLCCV